MYNSIPYFTKLMPKCIFFLLFSCHIEMYVLLRHNFHFPFHKLLQFYDDGNSLPVSNFFTFSILAALLKYPGKGLDQNSSVLSQMWQVAKVDPAERQREMTGGVWYASRYCATEFLHFAFTHFTFYILLGVCDMPAATATLNFYILHFTFYILHLIFYILHFTGGATCDVPAEPLHFHYILLNCLGQQWKHYACIRDKLEPYGWGLKHIKSIGGTWNTKIIWNVQSIQGIQSIQTIHCIKTI